MEAHDNIEQEEEIQYEFFKLWFYSCEGRRIWSMGRFREGTTSDQAGEIFRSTFRGGMGDDPSEFIEAEYGYDDDNYTDYTDTDYYW